MRKYTLLMVACLLAPLLINGCASPMRPQATPADPNYYQFKVPDDAGTMSMNVIETVGIRSVDHGILIDSVVFGPAARSAAYPIALAISGTPNLVSLTDSNERQIDLMPFDPPGTAPFQPIPSRQLFPAIRLGDHAYLITSGLRTDHTLEEGEYTLAFLPEWHDMYTSKWATPRDNSPQVFTLRE